MDLNNTAEFVITMYTALKNNICSEFYFLFSKLSYVHFKQIVMLLKFFQKK